MAGAAVFGELGKTALRLGEAAFNNHLAEKSAEKQYQRQLDFWEKQNAYNTPSAQRARVEAAGFNPASDQAAQYAGASAGQGLSDVPGNEFSQRGALDLGDLIADLEALSRIEQNGANVDLLQQEVKLAMVDYIIKNEEAFGLKLDNAKKEALLKYVDQEGQLTLEKLMAEIKNIESSTAVNVVTEDNVVADTNLKGEQAASQAKSRELMDAEILESNANAALAIVQASNYTREVDARIRNLDANSRQALSQANLNDSNFIRNMTEQSLLDLAATASKVVGFDVRTLPQSSGVDVIRQVNKFLNGEISVDEMDDRVYEIIMNCKIAENAIVITNTSSSSGQGGADILWGAIGASGSSSDSKSTQNIKNEPKNYR